MDFTREPIIETVITPREGCKLVVRSSKGPGQEEFFVDALEVVSFGSSFFFRSTERPKSFIVPTSDYEVLEVREARMVLKNVGSERTIKIAGGRETTPRQHKEHAPQPQPQQQQAAKAEEAKAPADKDAAKVDKKRDRRRNYRKRRGRGREDGVVEGEQEDQVDLPAPSVGEDERLEDLQSGTSIVSTLLPPPPTLISESLQRYKRMEFFPEEEALPGIDEEPVAEDTMDTLVNDQENTYDDYADEEVSNETDEEAVAKPEEQKQD